MSQLADKIAATVTPLYPLSLETNNISDLSSVEIASVRAALEAELKNRSFRLLPADSAAGALSATPVQFTISEGAQAFALVAQIQDRAAPERQPQIAIVAAPKIALGTDQEPDGSLTLDKRLIWQQPKKFLDFALLTGATELYSTLVILEPEELISYRSSGSQWQPWQTSPIPHSKPWPRDLHGNINVEGKTVELQGVQCKGDVFEVAKVSCNVAHQMLNEARLTVDIPGREGSLYAELFARCGPGAVVLATGTGDWTQPDSIQGYLHAGFKLPASASGAAIEFDGPVTAFWQEGRESSARAIVYNLKTKSYEGYIVTATCSH